MPEIENMPTDFEINLLINNVSEKKKLGDLYTIQTAYDMLNRFLAENPDLVPEPIKQTIEQLLVQNVIYDDETTRKEKSALLDNLSLTRGMAQSGQRIISTGELVTNEKFLVLESLKAEYEAQLGTSSTYYLIVIGQIVLVSISILVLIFFLLFFRKDVYASPKKIILILLLIIFMVFITSLIIKYDVGLLYLVPICLIPIVIRAFFDTRLALYVHIITIITIGFLVPNSFEFVFSQLIAGIIAVFSVVNLQRRSQFFLTSLMIFLTYSLVYVGL